MNEIKKPKILIVDDEQENIRVLAEVLKGNYKLIGARNGQVALECAFSDEPPDLILLDIMMPEMDGYEVIKQLKNNPKTQDIPVIFVTALGKETNEAQSLERGAVDYLTKPFLPASVTARVKIHLELKQYREQLEQMVYKRTEELGRANKRYREEINERKKIETQLRLQTTALEAAANAVVITDTKGIIVWMNKAFPELSGFSYDELIGKSLPLFRNEKQDDAFYQKMWETITSGQVWHGRLENRKKDGTFYMEEMTITPVREGGKDISHFIAIKQDISHEIEMEKQLRQAQKMEAIGTLTGGIAHDFNNILYAILGYSEMALKNIPEGSKIKHYLEQVVDAGKRAADLVNHILTFSRKMDHEKKPLKMQYVLKEALKLLQGSLPSTIRIDQAIDIQCPSVIADATQIHQVIMNLCTNAYHAMREKGGILKVALNTTVVDEAEAKKAMDIKPGKYIRLSVIDTGIGMDKETMSRIFEPFFTTKKAGEGTGLGLSTVHGIVKSHGGVIRVKSKPNVGTQFDLYFPAYEIAEVAVEPEKKEIVLPRGSESILLVDDELPLIQMNQALLEGFGYRVKGFTNSREALAVFKSSPSDFDLIVTDQTMPNMTGVQLAQEILKVRSDIPIIMCTGFSELVTPEQAKEMGIREFLKKPIIGSELGETIRRILNEGMEKMPQAKVA